MVALQEQNGLRDSVGRYLAEALRDLDSGYIPAILRPSHDVDERGRTRGGAARARARALLAAEIAEEFGTRTSRANAWVSFWCGMTPKALKRLRENIKKGEQLEVASLMPDERQKWEAQFQRPRNPHETLYYLALTEIGYDRAFHKK